MGIRYDGVGLHHSGASLKERKKNSITSKTKATSECAAKTKAN
jgi:hypothetical protein